MASTRIDRVIQFFGIETAAERSEWTALTTRLHETVLVNYFDKDFQSELSKEIHRLEAADTRDTSYGALEICAEERLRVLALCMAKCALPTDGAEASELEDLGFTVPGKKRNREFGSGVLRIVTFPEGWHMQATSQEPEISNTSGALVLDADGNTRMNVFYRHSMSGGSVRGHTHILD